MKVAPAEEIGLWQAIFVVSYLTGCQREKNETPTMVNFNFSQLLIYCVNVLLFHF